MYIISFILKNVISAHTYKRINSIISNKKENFNQKPSSYQIFIIEDRQKKKYRGRVKITNDGNHQIEIK